MKISLFQLFVNINDLFIKKRAKLLHKEIIEL